MSTNTAQAISKFNIISPFKVRRITREIVKMQAEKAMQGLLDVGHGSSDLIEVFSGMKTIIERFLEHQSQLQEQLEAAFSDQMKQMEQSLTQQTGMSVKVDPTMHPKFQEEWQRIQTELNEQYGNALNQNKKLVENRLLALFS